MTDEEFWNSLDILRHVLEVSRAQRVGPYAVLGTVMLRGVSTVPPTVTIPATIGGQQSLNLFVATVGSSGVGKGGSEAVGAEAVKFRTSSPDVEVRPVILPLGSGEGLARTFRVEEGEELPRVIFGVPEIDSLSALAGRQGSTLSAEARKMYGGEQLGFANAQKETRTVVQAHTYRACLQAGVQPLRSGPLLDAADGGLPQRFLWVPAHDPDSLDADTIPDKWSPRTVIVPSWSPGDLVIPAEAEETIVRARVAVLRDDPDVDPLDGHKLLCRLKAAAALAILQSSGEVTKRDWELSGHLIDVSDRTRESCRRALLDRSRRQNVARALESADHDEVVSERKAQRAREAILRWLSRAEQETLARRELSQKLKADVRPYFDAAIAELIDQGSVFEIPTQRGKAYSMANVVPQVHRDSPAPTPVVPGANVVPHSGRFDKAMTLVKHLNTATNTQETE